MPRNQSRKISAHHHGSRYTGGDNSSQSTEVILPSGPSAYQKKRKDKGQNNCNFDGGLQSTSGRESSSLFGPIGNQMSSESKISRKERKNRGIFVTPKKESEFYRGRSRASMSSFRPSCESSVMNEY